jgi:hypothetical protein
MISHCSFFEGDRFMNTLLVAASCAGLCSTVVLGGPKVCITEIMYNPLSVEKNNESEWVEIANTGAEAVDIKDWHLAVGDDAFGKFSCRLEPGAVLVLVNTAHVDEVKFREAWDAAGDPAPATGTTAPPTYQIIAVSWGSLGNNPKGGAALKLVDDAGAPVCEVTYHNGGEWPKSGKSGASIWLSDIAAANCSDGKLWRISEAGKDGARKCKVTAIFDKEDVGSPGHVAGLGTAAPPSKPGVTDPAPAKPAEDDHKIDY